MKICHLTTIHSRYDSRIFQKEIQSLVKENEIILLVADGKGNETIGKLSIIDLGKTELNILSRVFCLFKMLSTAKVLAADKYHFHDPDFLFFIKFYIRSKKIIYDVHEDYPEQILSKTWIPSIARGICSRIMKVMEKQFSKNIAGVITATDYINKRFIRYNSNSISVKNYAKLFPSNVSNRDNTADTLILCYSGGIYPTRGIYEMCETVRILNEEYRISSKLILAGKFVSQTLEKEILLKYNSILEYKGFVDKDEVYNMYKASDFGLVLLHPEPRFKVSLPIKMFEYMSAGLPVIASNFELWKNIIEENQCGICVNPLNPREICVEISKLRNKPSTRSSMSENGVKAVKENFSWEIEEKKLLKFYNEL